MFRFITVFLLVGLILAIIYLVIRVTAVFAYLAPRQVADVILAGLGILAFFAFLHAIAQIIGLFLHIKKR